MASEPVLVSPDFSKPFVVHTDASGFAIGCVLEQDHGRGLQPVEYFSRKLNAAETRYVTHEQELLAIVEACKHWSHYLKGSEITTTTDHRTMKDFLTQPRTSARQLRWAECLAEYVITVKYLEGTLNAVADALSRQKKHQSEGPTAQEGPGEDTAERSDGINWCVMTRSKTQGARTTPALAVSTPAAAPECATAAPDAPVESAATPASVASTCPELVHDHDFDEPHPAIGTVQNLFPEDDVLAELRAACDRAPVATDIISTLHILEVSAKGGESAEESLLMQPPSDAELHRIRGFELYNGILYRETPIGSGEYKLYIPDCKTLRARLLYLAHDSPLAGHCGKDKTVQLMMRHYFWPGMRTDVEQYVASCPSCQRNKPEHTKTKGLYQPLPETTRRYEHITMDLITGLPPTKRGHNAVLTVVDRLSKKVSWIATTDTIDAPGIADLIYRRIFCEDGWGMPRYITTDRGPQFAARFIQCLYDRLDCKPLYSTAYHPQTDGQSEKANQVLEEMLRHFVQQDHSDWDQHLHTCAFAYNNSVNRSTGVTPFFLCNGQHPNVPAFFDKGVP